MKPGDLIRYRGLDPCGKDSALGLCLKKEIDPGIPHLGKRMLVMWFDDYLATYEDLSVCDKDDWMELISERKD